MANGSKQNKEELKRYFQELKDNIDLKENIDLNEYVNKLQELVSLFNDNYSDESLKSLMKDVRGYVTGFIRSNSGYNDGNTRIISDMVNKILTYVGDDAKEWIYQEWFDIELLEFYIRDYAEAAKTSGFTGNLEEYLTNYFCYKYDDKKWSEMLDDMEHIYKTIKECDKKMEEVFYNVFNKQEIQDILSTPFFSMKVIRFSREINKSHKRNLNNR